MKVSQLDASRDDWLMDQVMRREPSTPMIDAQFPEKKALKAKYGQQRSLPSPISQSGFARRFALSGCVWLVLLEAFCRHSAD